MCCKLPATFALFSVLSHGYAHAQLSSFYPLSTFDGGHMRKIPASPCLHNLNVHVPDSVFWKQYNSLLVGFLIHSPTTYVSVQKASKFGANRLFHVGVAYLYCSAATSPFSFVLEANWLLLRASFQS